MAIRSIGHNEKGVLVVGMEEQLKQAYKNAKKLLEGFGMSREDVAEEVLYVLDMKTAFEARKTFGRKFLSELQTSSQYNSYGWRISYTQSIN